MNLLKREIAPITPDAWKEIDQEARRVLSVHLAARRIVDVDGPHGWGLAAVNTGVLDLFDSEPQEGVSAGMRKVQPLVELRAGFKLDLMELDSISRGSETPNLDAVARAAEKIALAEDNAVFNGYAQAGIEGLLAASPHTEASFGTTPEEHMSAVVKARQALEDAGVGGPYTLALGPRPYTGLMQALEGGDSVFRRVRDVVGGPIVQARALEGGVLVSTRGGDFTLTVGQDFSIGYVTADRTEVELYLASSFTFRAVGPEAAVRLP